MHSIAMVIIAIGLWLWVVLFIVTSHQQSSTPHPTHLAAAPKHTMEEFYLSPLLDHCLTTPSQYFWAVFWLGLGLGLGLASCQNIFILQLMILHSLYVPISAAKWEIHVFNTIPKQDKTGHMKDIFFFTPLLKHKDYKRSREIIHKAMHKPSTNIPNSNIFLSLHDTHWIFLMSMNPSPLHMSLHDGPSSSSSP